MLLAVGGVISALCLWLALRHVSFGEVWKSLREAHWVWLVPSLALTYLTLAARACRWRYLFCEPERVSTWESTKALNIGLMFNNILPSRAGEVPRALALARVSGLSKVEVGTTIVVERLLDVFSIAVAGVIAWPFLPHVAWIRALVIICAVIFVGLVAAAVLLWAFRRRARTIAERLLRRLPLVSDERGSALADSLARGGRIFREPRRLALALVLSALVWTITVLAVLALFPAFDLQTSMSNAWLIVIATSLAMTVPSTSGALGVYEAAVLASLVAAGIARGPALSFALVLHAVNFVPVSLTGALAAWSYVGRFRRDEPSASVPAP